VKDSGAGKEVTDPMEEQVSELEIAQKTTDLEKEKGKLQKEELNKKQKELTIYSNFAGVVQKLDKDAAQSSSQALGGQGKAFLQVASKDQVPSPRDFNRASEVTNPKGSNIHCNCESK